MKKNVTPKRILEIATFILIVLVFLFGTKMPIAEAQDSSAPDNSNWMKDYDPRVLSGYGNGYLEYLDIYRPLQLTPPIPTDVSASDGTYADKVRVSWSGSEFADYYKVYRNTSNTTSGATEIGVDWGGSPFDDTTGTPGTTYYYWVKACAPSMGCSDYSESDTGWWTDQPPTPPSDVDASDGDFTDKVRVTWDDTLYATYYKIYHGRNSDEKDLIEDHETGLSYDDTSATIGYLYYYWVKACNIAGCSDYSDHDFGWIPLQAPTNVNASNCYTDKVRVSWDSSTGAEFYQIYRTISDTFTGEGLLEDHETGLLYDDTTAVPGTTYYYWVQARTAGGGSPVNSSQGCRVVLSPNGVSASDGTYTDKVRVSWDSSLGATHYEIYRNTSNTTTGATMLEGEDSTSPYDDTSATPGTTYYYWVRACSGLCCECSSYSNSDSGFRAVEPPEMDVQGKGQSITNGDIIPSTTDDTDFGEAVIGEETVTHTFTIENTGDGDLTLSGDPKVQVTGTHAADFTVTAQPSSPVAAGGGTATFDVTFDPGDEGLREAQVNIENDDPDEDPYTFAIQGTGTSAPQAAVLADFDGDGDTDISVFRPSNGNWYVKGMSPVSWALAGDLPEPGDYDGDGTTDIAVYRPSNGKWYVKGQGSTSWGFTGDIPMQADYDGDGADEIAVLRPSNHKWYIQGMGNFSWHQTGDIPVPCDYDGDGADEIAVLRPSNGKWYIKGMGNFSWYQTGDIPVPADYDGDGTCDIAVYRPSNGNWYVRGQGYTSWGFPDDIPVPGDYDGNGAVEMAVLRPSNGKWYIQGMGNFSWYLSGDYPLPARDTNADGDVYE